MRNKIALSHCIVRASLEHVASRTEPILNPAISSQGRSRGESHTKTLLAPETQSKGGNLLGCPLD